MQLSSTIVRRNNVTIIDWLAIAFMAVVALLVPGKWSILWVNGKTFFATVILCVMAVMLLKGKHKLSLNWFHLIILLLSVLSLISGFWAINSSLVFKCAGTWLFFLILTLVVQLYMSYGVNLKFLIKSISIIYFINFGILIGAIIYANFIEFPEQPFYNNISRLTQYFGYNGNYISAFMVMFFPIVFFSKHNMFSKITFKWLVTIVVSLTVVLLNSRASTLALGFVLLMLLLKQLKTITFKKTLVFISILGVAAIVLPLIDVSFWKMYNPLFGLDGGNDRLILWESTLQFAKQSPMLGVGSGNWVITYPSEDLGKLNSMIDRFNYFVHPHNLYLHIFSEIGLVGSLLFMALIIVTMLRVLARKLANKHYLLIIVIGVFLIVGFFYGITYALEVDIPSTHIGFIVALAILGGVVGKNKVSISKRLTKIGFLILLPILLVWFSYSSFNHSAYAYSKMKLKDFGQKFAIENIDQLYSKKFFTVIGSESVLQIKIDYLIKKKKYNEAAVVISAALSDHPNNPKLHYSQGLCLLKQNELDRAAGAFEKSLRHNSRLYRSHYQLAYIAAQENDLEEFYKLKNKMSQVYTIMGKLENYKNLEQNKTASRYQKRFKGYLDKIEKLENDLISNQNNS